MKLGDVLPHWLFRERAGIEAEIGGGAAFAHLFELSELDGGSAVVAPVPGAPYASTYVEITQFGTISGNDGGHVFFLSSLALDLQSPGSFITLRSPDGAAFVLRVANDGTFSVLPV